MVCTITSWLVRGRPRQFMEMWEKSLCSILFHFDVPGGRWHTVMVRPVSAANAASSVFHSRVREPLDPPPSAVISSRDAFAVATIRRWWRSAANSYPHASRLLITADGGGSNGSRTRLWKTELAAFAADTGLTI